MDIDVLLFGEQVLNDPRLVVPHPHMHARPFVLVPLRDLAPDLVHPTLSVTIAQLVERCNERDGVARRAGGPEWLPALGFVSKLLSPRGERSGEG